MFIIYVCREMVAPSMNRIVIRNDSSVPSDIFDNSGYSCCCCFV